MYTQIEKSKENKIRSTVNFILQNKSNVKQDFGFVDNRTIQNEVTPKKKFDSPNALQCKLPDDSQLRKLTIYGFKKKFGAERKHITYSQWEEIFNYITSDEFVGESETDVKKYIDSHYPKIVDSGQSSIAKITSNEAEPSKPIVKLQGTEPLMKPVVKTEKKFHKTVANGGKKIIINYVWLGNNALTHLEKFNISSWRALGHDVNIYILPFASKAPQTSEELGLEASDATVIPLTSILSDDESIEDAENPKKKLTDARLTLKNWIEKLPADVNPTKEHIYNMVDMAKSYIGGTRQGIVLDMKVGPSVHLQDFVESFYTKLISYTRGGNTFGDLPENQCIGTMQETDELRNLYATKFNERVKTGLSAADPNKLWFNLITGYHGQSYQQSQNWLDVATKKPDGKPNEDGFKVSEPGGYGHGPFRVFKNASDQSNRSGGKTDPNSVFFIAEEALKELREGNGDATFIKKAGDALSNFPRKKLL